MCSYSILWLTKEEFWSIHLRNTRKQYCVTMTRESILYYVSIIRWTYRRDNNIEWYASYFSVYRVGSVFLHLQYFHDINSENAVYDSLKSLVLSKINVSLEWTLCGFSCCWNIKTYFYKTKNNGALHYSRREINDALERSESIGTSKTCFLTYLIYFAWAVVKQHH